MTQNIVPDNFTTPLLIESAAYLYKVTIPVFNFMSHYSNPVVAGLAATAATAPLIANLNNLHNTNERLFTEKTFYPSTFNPLSEVDFSTSFLFSGATTLLAAVPYYYYVTKPTFNFVASHTPQGIEYVCAGVASYVVTTPILMFAKHLLFASIGNGITTSAPSDQNTNEEYTNPIGWLYEHLTSEYTE